MTDIVSPYFFTANLVISCVYVCTNVYSWQVYARYIYFASVVLPLDALVEYFTSFYFFFQCFPLHDYMVESRAFLFLSYSLAHFLVSGICLSFYEFLSRCPMTQNSIFVAYPLCGSCHWNPVSIVPAHCVAFLVCQFFFNFSPSVMAICIHHVKNPIEIPGWDVVLLGLHRGS